MSLSCVRLLVTPWTAAHQAPPSMGFSRQEYWSGVSLPSPVPLAKALVSSFVSLSLSLSLFGTSFFKKRNVCVCAQVCVK